MAHAGTDRAGPDSQEPQLYDTDRAADPADLYRLRHDYPEPNLPAGTAWLYGLEGGTRDGAARNRSDGRDVFARRHRAARLRYPSNGSVWLLSNWLVGVAAGRARPDDVDEQVRLADGHTRDRDGPR